ncbi:MAG TPA: SPOR domain-containing protein [Geobacteraceae bacterium]
MVIDYSSQRPVSKNRPRKQPAAIFVIALLVTACATFLIGVGVGWLMFSPGRKGAAVSPLVSQRGGDSKAPGQTQAPPQAAVKATEPSLTFYETLPKGSRELMGSGLNLPKQAEQPSAPSAKAAPKPKAAPAKTAPSEQAQEQGKKEAKIPVKEAEKSPAREGAKEGEGKGKFVVQVASYHVKKEAEEARDRLKAEGLAAYVVEINIPEKGTYYRVRLGRHLDQQAAREIAEKAGKGSILIPE